MSNKSKKIINTQLTSLNGWCTIEKALYIYDLIYSLKLKHCVELGVYAGRSLLPIGLAVKDLKDLKDHEDNEDNEDDSFVYGIDSWDIPSCLEGLNDKANDEWWSKLDIKMIYNCAKNLLKKYKLTDIVKLKKNKSYNECNNFNDNSIDLLHQDSNHSTEISCKEILLYNQKIKSGGFWIMDDTDWNSTKEAQNLILTLGYTCYDNFNTWKIYRKQ